jgi:Zn-finger nucleic acid-binding protein
MPLLLCPNDNGAMQTVQRSGVEFDICPTCRGVWLDRGELEKLLAAARDVAPSERSDDDRPARAAFVSKPQPEREKRRDWDDDDRYHQKKRRSSIFDIFD